MLVKPAIKRILLIFGVVTTLRRMHVHTLQRYSQPVTAYKTRNSKRAYLHARLQHYAV